MTYLLFNLCIWVALLFGLTGANENGNKAKYTYQKIWQTRSNTVGLVVVLPGEIRGYDPIKLDINNLTPADSEFIRYNTPGWKGEKYKVIVYKWDGNLFTSDTIYYSDTISKGGTDWEDYNNGDRNLKLPDRYLKNKDISSELRISLVKSYTEEDLDSDGKTDFVMVYQDTTGKKDRWTYAKKENYHLVVFENKGNGKYAKKFSYDFPTPMIYIGKVDTQEVTGDNLPEIILWTVGAGGSGYSEKVEIFSRVKE
ncbi:MAG: hypothetical protein A2145_03925 [candidate division Zixibacteria bacterium RBG_16_40_9]|nr:MAG: hypothetical protein A2145_03925 [candidate division Zixibacteria bacterium RBG_16_40_9]